jgi:protocatechuate 3,4-dioxygenase beta subunit
VRGRVLLERVDETALDEGDTTTGDAGETDTESHASDTTAAIPEPRTPVETFPPGADTCRIVAWQAGREVAARTSCDEAGEFEVTLFAGTTGVVAFDIEVPGRLRAVVEVDVPTEGIGRLPTVALGLGQTVSGTVTDGRGAPVGDVEIDARPIPDLGEPEPWRTRSDTEGRFAFDTLPPGPVVLRVASPQHAESVLEVIAPESEVELIASTLYDFRGNIVGPEDVLARTIVRIEGSGVWPVREAALAGGSFVFEKIPDGVYALQAVAIAREPGDPEFASIPLENVSPDARVTLALATAYRVPVHVTDPDGAPIEGARVTLGSAHLGLLAQRDKTDADGRVAIGPAPNGAYVVRVDADGFLGADPVALDIADADATPIEVRLAKPGYIAGIVVDEDDRPVADASIDVRSDAPFSMGEGRVRTAVFERATAAGSLGVTTGPVPEIPLGPVVPEQERGEIVSDADGRFVLADLAPGVYTLQASHGRWAASDVVDVRVHPGAVIEGIRLVLRNGEPLTGRVVDGNDRPLDDAWVELADGSAYATDSRGVFEAGLRRGVQVIVARAPGKAAVRREVTVRDMPVDIEIRLDDADAIVRGHVVDDNDRPLEFVQVTLSALDEVSPSDAIWTDARGQFVFEYLPAGPVELSFDAADHAPTTMRAVATDPARARELEVVLVRGWTLRVDVRDRDTDDPIADAVVTVRGQRGRTDIRGVLELSALGDASVVVEVDAAGYGSARREVARGDGDRIDVVIELSQGGGLEGVVTDWRGDPVAGATVIVRVGDEIVDELQTSARGHFAATGIPEGDVVLEAVPPADREDDLAAVSQRTDVLQGRTTRGIDLRFERR